MSQDKVIAMPSKEDYTKWEYNGHEYHLDFADVETVERYETVIDQMAEDEKNVKKTGKTSEILKSYCSIYYNFFDRLFGDGAGKDILGEKENASACHVAYMDFLGFVANQRKGIQSYQNEIRSKYGNRASRRAAQKQNSKK